MLPTYPEIARDPQAAANGMFVELSIPVSVVSARWTAHHRGRGAEDAGACGAELGEHTEAVLAELGYSPAAIADLLARGIAIGRRESR